MNRIDLRPMAHSYQALLDRATKVFHIDERVRAMWLHGAIARGAQDAGSDLDIDIAVRDEDFDTFTAESTSWWAKITPTVSRREMANMPGSFFALTPTCERVDVVTERVSDLSVSKLTRRVTVFDRDNLTAHVPKPTDPDANPEVIRYCVEETLRQAANFPIVLIRQDWLMGVVAVQQIHFFLYELFTEANKPMPPTGPKQWSYKLTSEQRKALEHLPVPQAERNSIIAARLEALRFFEEQASAVAQRHGVVWPSELAAAVHAYMKRSEAEMGVRDLDW
jgi:predicted nucleotidyltransferase